MRVTEGILAGSERIVACMHSKAALRRATGAAAVDMESHIAAHYADENSLPFAALRVVADPASRTLPEVAVAALKSDGKIDPWRVLRGVARRPHAIPALMRPPRGLNLAVTGDTSCRGL